MSTTAHTPSLQTPQEQQAPQAHQANASSSTSLSAGLAARPDFRAIARWVEPRSSVLDLGCGDGSLLAVLKEELDIQGYGIEIDDAGVLACVQKGVNVVQQNLEDGLRLIDDNSFDLAVLSQTLQTIHQTAAILRETVRVARQCIVSFPNFGYWPHRLAVLKGRMPVSPALPYQWHNTPNVRVLTIDDFEALASDVGIRICERVVLTHDRAVSWGANWRGSLAVYRVERI
jgi:methionine biosynthesis protein MetW